MLAPRGVAVAVVAVVTGTAIAVALLVAGSPDHHIPAVTALPAATAQTVAPAQAGGVAQAAVIPRVVAGTPPFLVELANAAPGQLFVQKAGTTRITARIPAPKGALQWDAIAAAKRDGVHRGSVGEVR